MGGLLLLAVIGGGVVLLRRGDAAPAVTYSTDTATEGTVSVLVNGPGTLGARLSTPYPAPLGGTVTGLPAVGTVVKAGQVVGRVHSDTTDQAVRDAELALQRAQAQLAAQGSSGATSTASRDSAVASARLNVQDAANTAASAHTTLDGQSRLYAAGAISRADLDAARTAAQSADSKLASAQASLTAALRQSSAGQASDADTLRGQQLAVQEARAALADAQATQAKETLRAPAAGLVTSVDAVNGANVAAGTSLLTVADVRAMQVPVQVDETQISQVRVGMPARATLDALDGETVEGRVTAISPTATVSNNISIFTVTVELPNPDGRLRAGMSAQTDIVIAEQGGLVISQKAVETVRTRSYVQRLPADVAAQAARDQPQTAAATQAGGAGASALQVDAAAAGKAVQTRVRTGLTDGTSIVVTGGLQEGDTVLLPQTRPPGTGTFSGSSFGGGSVVGRGGTGSGTRGGLPGGFGGF
ncbi:RND transporter [Deinococcus aquiradiocola]|uniref:RND transporter n=1 Tax=Deinococcus aquiradiocola TaxID=393059 RepID=A0A917UNC9_9DEIO|nr:RND transporter [Deinococcus aquiradiocola]